MSKASPPYAAAKPSPRAFISLFPRNFWEKSSRAIGSNDAPSGERCLAGGTYRAATSDEVKALRREARALKEVVAEQALELRLLKKSMIADGEGEE